MQGSLFLSGVFMFLACSALMNDTLKQQDDVENRDESLRKLLNNPKKAKAIQENKKDRSDARKEVRSPENLLRSRQDASTFDASKHVQAFNPEDYWNSEAGTILQEECCNESCDDEEIAESIKDRWEQISQSPTGQRCRGVQMARERDERRCEGIYRSFCKPGCKMTLDVRCESSEYRKSWKRVRNNNRGAV